MQDKKIIIASDHAGFSLKRELINYLVRGGYEVQDMGTDSENPVDYPDVAQKAVQAMHAQPNASGIFICGTGEGMCMAANRYSFIRAGLAYNPRTAELIRRHNNANVLCLGARLITLPEAMCLTDIFLNTPFDAERHALRLRKLRLLGGELTR